MVMPRSRSISIESSTCSLPAISRSVRPPVIWIRRSASVDFPWSIWATMEKLRMLGMGTVVMGRADSIPSPQPATILLNFQGLSSRQADSPGAENRLPRADVEYLSSASDGAPARPFRTAAPRRLAGRARHRAGNLGLGRDRLRRRPRRAVDGDPDQSEGGSGHPYGRRRGLCLGQPLPAGLWQASAAVGLDRGPVVHGVSGQGLGDL